MLYKKPLLHLSVIFLFSLVLLASGCISPSEKTQKPKLLKTENATQFHLLSEVNRFAKVNSMRAKMYLKFEDNSFAESGLAEKYKTVDGEVVVQRPANILLKVQIPILKSDIVQMSSNGEKFRVAILEDGAGGKYKKFVLGTNDADYSVLQEEVKRADFSNGNGQELKQNVNAFSNLRPQHFTDAMLVRSVDTKNFAYVESTILQEEEDPTQPKKSPLRKVLRGYYLLDELRKNEDGTLTISRRFWFDRVGGIRLARQQIFDAKLEIESDIVYGKEGNLSNSGEYTNLPLRVEVTRPKEKYKMSLEYQTPDAVTIGKTYPEKAFVLENIWNLQEVDLDKKAQEMKNRAISTEKPEKEKENK
jgi:hypothetical protein